jgi:hypothetical protein
LFGKWQFLFCDAGSCSGGRATEVGLHADSPLKFKPSFNKPGIEIEIGGLAVDGGAVTVVAANEVVISGSGLVKVQLKILVWRSGSCCSGVSGIAGGAVAVNRRDWGIGLIEE